MEPSRAVVPTGWLLHGGSHGGQGNHDRDSRTDAVHYHTGRVEHYVLRRWVTTSLTRAD
jgi:hypothetical protein